MNLSELLTTDLVLFPLRAEDKWQAIAALARATVDAGGLAADMFDTVHDALVTRERSMTTGMEQGIAIPHAAIDGIPNAIAVLAIAPDGIPFEALDGKPAKIIVCLLIPRSKKILHIKTLAEIAKLLTRPEVREALVSGSDAAEILDRVRTMEKESA